MLKATMTFRNLTGIVSPFLCAYQPPVLREVLTSGKTRENIHLVMQEVCREHILRSTAIFPETRELVRASADFDPSGYSARLLSFVDEQKTDVPLFEVLLSNADDGQIHETLKVAVKKNDMESVKRILPFVKNQQQTLDKLFIELRNTTKISLAMIRELLPQCSKNVQSKYLNEMIIQRNREAVRAIISFYQPTQDHMYLANKHLSSGFQKVFQKTAESLQGFTGIVNLSMVEDMVNRVKESAKQIVHTSFETAKLALRMLGISPAPTELVAVEGGKDLINIDGLMLNLEDIDFYLEQMHITLLEGKQALPAGKSSLIENSTNELTMRDLLLMIAEKGQQTPRLTSDTSEKVLGIADNKRSDLVSENIRLALSSQRIDDRDEETGEFFTFPRPYQPVEEEQNDGFGRAAAATVVALGLGAFMDRTPAEEEIALEQPVVANRVAEEKAPVLAEQVVEEEIAVEQPVVANQVVEEKAPVLAEQVVEEPVKAEEKAPITKPFIARKYRLHTPTYWEKVYNQMVADRKAGFWRI
ncbi:MAG TPA: hypothetical protein VLE96_07600 [Chlamydiales bacterium]|nr:hypothetical protein [Chlamydiales bacterium]